MKPTRQQLVERNKELVRICDKLQDQKTSLHTALGGLLGDCDYESKNCSPTDMVGAVIKPQILRNAREAYKNAK